MQKHNLELQQQEIEQRREAAIEQKNLEYLEHIIKNPQDLFYTLCANPDVHYMPMFVPLAAKYNLLDKLLTSEVLTIPMIVNSFDLNDLCCIIDYVCDSSNPKALLGNLFEIEGFKLKLAEYVDDEQIIKRLSYAIEYPEVASAVLNLQNININLLTSAFAVLVKNQGIDGNVFDYFDFANLQHKEAFESMIFGSDISKKLKSWLLNKALEKGYDFSYIGVLSTNPRR
ncbi:hypothetical protein [Candidatus Trichorickettsia mobilis]|uniref:hypothetical protein n=1 Tax=Candidatus Trichorickettsia mobilis TaxID=1346319 RepID=UPI00292F74F3|nr:hypothetical protein [Candidatus Trichorickettsia mobilis]